MGRAKSDEAGPDLDLFGNPVAPMRDPRGRPQYAKTKENQMLVITLAGSGWSQDQIAAYMGCDPKTLRKHFSRELDNGALFLEGMAMQTLVKRMLDDGNMAATKAVREIAAARNAPKAKTPAAAKEPSIGKKASLIESAKRPPDGWGDLVN